ncbi:unnamed protein product [Acanthosepion pharaonis]|uniref:Uncharacterized protein n=1 Tax=Acanthosepion pharaonis TaxID=158019 RepID=A0A812C0T6_ACAPH|nr:unnamed protein product [Sepia pharaonis]CAE1248539.1 unnamed protein product [Sepia pharaonis]
MALANDCPLPKVDANSYSEVNGSVVTYHCKGGFRFYGKTRNSTCTNGSWETIKFSCIETCGSPPKIPNANLINSKEDSAIYKCDLNFSTNSNRSTNFDIKLNCNESQWEIPNITCLKTSRNSSYNLQDTISEENVTFMPVVNTSTSFYENDTLDKMNTSNSEKESRNSSFYNLQNISKENVIVPLVNISASFYENDTLDKMNTFEPEKTCPEAIEIPNSIKLNDSEGNITYSCKSGYIQHGYNPKSFCENGTWTETDIQCVPENVIKKKKLFYEKNDFEKPGSLICSFLKNEQNCSCVATVTLMKLIPNQKIALHNYASFPTTSVWECVKSCLENNSCLSLEFYKTKNMCYLSKTSSYFVDSIIVMKKKDVIYGEKTCQSTMPDKEVAYLPFHLEDIPVNTLLCNVTQEVTFCGVVPSWRNSSINLSLYINTILCSITQEVTFCNMLQQADNAYHLNNFEAVPPNSLFCSIDQEKTFCGCIQREFLFSIAINKKIAMHNMHSFHADDIKKCIQECQHRQNCLSAEFKEDKKIILSFVIHQTLNILRKYVLSY